MWDIPLITSTSQLYRLAPKPECQSTINREKTHATGGFSSCSQLCGSKRHLSTHVYKADLGGIIMPTPFPDWIMGASVVYVVHERNEGYVFPHPPNGKYPNTPFIVHGPRKLHLSRIMHAYYIPALLDRWDVMKVLMSLPLILRWMGLSYIIAHLPTSQDRRVEKCCTSPPRENKKTHPIELSDCIPVRLGSARSKEFPEEAKGFLHTASYRM